MNFSWNKKAKGRYKEKKKLDSGNTVYVYGPRQVAKRHKEKAERLDKLQDKISDLRKKYKAEISSNPIALVVALIDETAERVGNPTSAKEGHFGVTEWKKEHLKFSNGKVTITYIGKSGVSQKKTVKNKKIVSALKKISKDLIPGDELFPDVRAKDVNKYLKSYDISAKDLRGYHANDTMQCILKRIRKEGPELPRSRKEKDKILKKEFEKALKETAKIVGHKSTTLKNQYLVPGLEDKYLHNGEVMSRMKVAKAIPVSAGQTRWGEMVWYMPLSKDSFIHFTFESRISEILKANKLLMNPPYRKFGIDAVSAISTSWGKLVPGVQTTHLRRVSKEPIAAILFKTNSIPEYGRIEEVVWDRDVVFSSAKRITFAKALQMLQSTFDGIDDQDIVVYDKRLLKKYLKEDTYKVSTLTKSEKEDRESSSQIKGAPKSKPPRYDLRRNRSTPGEDNKEQDELTREENKDISRRSRHMASLVWKVATFYLRAQEEDKKKEHKPGEVWETDKNKWRGKNPDGLAESFDTQEEAKEFADGTEPSKEEESEDHGPGDVWEEDGKWKAKNPDGLEEEFDSEEEAKDFGEGTTEEEAKEEDTTSVSDSDLNTAKRIINSVFDDDDVFDEDLQSSLKDVYDGLDEDQKKQFAKALEANLKTLSGQDAHTKSMADMANKAIEFSGYKGLTDPQELGKKFSEAVFARNVIANPMVLDGKKFSQEALSAEKASKKAMRAYEHFSNLSPKLKKHAAEKLDRYLKKLPEDHPHQNEANAILSAIAVSAIAKGEDPVPGRPEPSKGSAQLIRQLAEQGNINILLKPVEDYFEPKNQEVLKGAMKKMSTDELFDLVMKEDEEYKEPHPYAGLKELFDQDIPIPYPWNEGIRDFIINDYLSDHIWKDTAIRDSVKNSGKDIGAEERFKMLSEIKREAQSALFEQWQKCLQDAQKSAEKGSSTSKSTEDCLKDFEESKKELFAAESAGQFLEALSKRGLELPNSPSIAALKNVAETGDTSILGNQINPNPNEFSGKTASYRLLFDSNKLLHTRLIFSENSRFARRQNMKRLSKKAAQKIAHSCDELANFFQKHASDIGLSPKVGEDMAKRLDTMAVFVEDAAGVKMAKNPTDTVYPTENYTEEPLQNWEMDPADVGEEDSGALLRDQDEPYMDVFKQDEFRQLREVQQSGMFSNAKAASAAVLKMAKLLAENGIAIPVEGPAKKKASFRRVC